LHNEATVAERGMCSWTSAASCPCGTR
jgi:hypothetical protein